MMARRTSRSSPHAAEPSRSGRKLRTVQENDCVVALKALGEETRVQIVALLLEHALDVGEIAGRLGVSQYNVSKHLRILREAGLLQVEKHGRRRLYSLPDDTRRSARAGKVLDLGCCRFRFDARASAAARDDVPRKRVLRVPARLSR
jgi:DNA-binding transcriptional ArsR family regulator